MDRRIFMNAIYSPPRRKKNPSMAIQLQTYKYFTCQDFEIHLQRLYHCIWEMIPYLDIEIAKISNGEDMLTFMGVSQNGRNRLLKLSSVEVSHLCVRFPSSPKFVFLYFTEVQRVLHKMRLLNKNCYDLNREKLSDNICNVFAPAAFFRQLKQHNLDYLPNEMIRQILIENINYSTFDSIKSMIDVIFSSVSVCSGAGIDQQALNNEVTDIRTITSMLDLYMAELLKPTEISPYKALAEHCRIYSNHYDDEDYTEVADSESIWPCDEPTLEFEVSTTDFWLVLDWILATKPVLDKNRIRRGWTHLQHLAGEWHNAEIQGNYIDPYGQLYSLARWSCKLEDHILEWNNFLPKNIPYQLVSLTSQKQLAEEAKIMSHCVVTYGDYCVRGMSRIFSVRNLLGNIRIATIELIYSGNQWKINQIKGKSNLEMIHLIQLKNDPMHSLIDSLIYWYNKN